MSDHSALNARVDALLDWVAWVCTVLAGLAVVVLVVTFGWLVFGRFVLNDTPTWVEQLALLLICYIVFLGAGAGLRDETHLGVTVFRDMLPIPAQKVVVIVIDVILAAFGLMTLLAGMRLMQFGWDSLLPMLDIPESFRTLAITTLGALMLGICSIRAVLRIISFSRWTPASDFEPPKSLET